MQQKINFMKATWLGLFVFASASFGWANHTDNVVIKEPNSNADFYNGGVSPAINNPPIGSSSVNFVNGISKDIAKNPIQQAQRMPGQEVEYDEYDSSTNLENSSPSNYSRLNYEGGSATAIDPQADNTRVNKRDRQPSEVTADQQKSNSTDLEVTRRIRQDLVNDKSLSTYAHNIKIITINGNVTLKGPVRTAQEEKMILSRARAIAGASRVTNKLAIAPNGKQYDF